MKLRDIRLNSVFISNHHDHLTVFTVAFSLRILPEILSWPWLIGWDTPEYVAALKDFIAMPTILGKSVWYGRSRLLPPLLNMLLYPLSFLVDPWYIFKFAPPIIYGLEAVAFYHLVDSLGLSRRARYLSTLIFAFYPVSLRFSWDLHRNSLGLIFLIGLLAELIREESPLRVSLLSIGAFLSNEFTFVLSLLMLGLSIFIDLKRSHEIRRWVPKLLALSLGLLITCILFIDYGPSNVIRFSRIDLSQAAKVKLLPAAILFLPLLIPLPAGFMKLKDTYITSFLLAIAFFSFSNIIVPIEFPVWNRWMYHMVIPLSIYAGAGVNDRRWYSAYLLAIVLFGIAFATLPYRADSGAVVTMRAVSHVKLSGFDVFYMIEVLKSISEGTRMTYTMMHTTVPLQLESQYMDASSYVSTMEFDKLFVDLEGYGFVHIERRFGLNVSIVHLTKEWRLSPKFLERLLSKGIREFYVLGRKGMNIIVRKGPPSYRLVVGAHKDFGTLTLYKCVIAEG